MYSSSSFVNVLRRVGDSIFLCGYKALSSLCCINAGSRAQSKHGIRLVFLAYRAQPCNKYCLTRLKGICWFNVRSASIWIKRCRVFSARQGGFLLLGFSPLSLNEINILEGWKNLLQTGIPALLVASGFSVRAPAVVRFVYL